MSDGTDSEAKAWGRAILSFLIGVVGVAAGWIAFWATGNRIYDGSEPLLNSFLVRLVAIGTFSSSIPILIAPNDKESKGWFAVLAGISLVRLIIWPPIYLVGMGATMGLAVLATLQNRWIALVVFVASLLI